MIVRRYYYNHAHSRYLKEIGYNHSYKSGRYDVYILTTEEAESFRELALVEGLADPGLPTEHPTDDDF